MKTVFLSLLLAATALSCGGCMFMSNEDKDFYGKGWVKPNDLDAPMPHHSIADPSRPQQVASAPTAASAAQPPTQWLVPETAPQ